MNHACTVDPVTMTAGTVRPKGRLEVLTRSQIVLALKDGRLWAVNVESSNFLPISLLEN